MNISLRVKWALGFAVIGGLATTIGGGSGVIAGIIIFVTSYILFWYLTGFYLLAEFLMRKTGLSLFKIAIVFGLLFSSLHLLTHPGLLHEGGLFLLFYVVSQVIVTWVQLIIIGAILT